VGTCFPPITVVRDGRQSANSCLSYQHLLGLNHFVVHKGQNLGVHSETPGIP